MLPVWPMIFDAYFEESNPILAFHLLQTLIFFPIEKGNINGLKQFIHNYTQANTQIREFMVNGQVPNIQII